MASRHNRRMGSVRGPAGMMLPASSWILSLLPASYRMGRQKGLQVPDWTQVRRLFSVDGCGWAAMSLMMSDDGSDLTAALAGDREAFARLYDRHAAVVLSLCRRGCSQAEAEDACQETFLRAYSRLDQVREPAGLRPWLYAIARRVCSDRRRSAERRGRHEEQAGMNLLASPPETPSPPGAVEQAEQLTRLTAALDRLPDDERLPSISTIWNLIRRRWPRRRSTSRRAGSTSC